MMTAKPQPLVLSYSKTLHRYVSRRSLLIPTVFLLLIQIPCILLCFNNLQFRTSPTLLNHLLFQVTDGFLNLALLLSSAINLITVIIRHDYVSQSTFRSFLVCTSIALLPIAAQIVLFLCVPVLGR